MLFSVNIFMLIIYSILLSATFLGLLKVLIFVVLNF